MLSVIQNEHPYPIRNPVSGNSPIEKKEFLQITTTHKALLDMPMALSPDEYMQRIYIIGQIGYYLFDNRTYTKAILYFDEAVQLWQQIPDPYPPIVESDHYRNMRFYRACCNYRMKNKEAGRIEFAALAKLYPQDEGIKSWLNGANDDKWYKVRNTGWYIVYGLLIIHLFIPADYRLLKLIDSCLAVLIGISTAILGYWLKRREKQKR